VAGVDGVADALADKVVADGPAVEAMLFENRATAFAVVGLGHGTLDIEVITPTGQFEAFVAHIGCEGGHLFEGKIGPLACEEGAGAWHGKVLRGGDQVQGYKSRRRSGFRLQQV
jgi:hypothetical protein